MIASKQKPTRKRLFQDSFSHSYVANSVKQVPHYQSNESEETQHLKSSYSSSYRNQSAGKTYNNPINKKLKTSRKTSPDHSDPTDPQQLQNEKQLLRKAIQKQKQINDQIRQEIHQTQEQHKMELDVISGQIEKLRLTYQQYEEQIRQLEDQALKLDV